MKIQNHYERGQLALVVLLFGSLAIVIMGGFIIWADSQLRVAKRSNDQSLAFKIAEAGVEYYRWHLAHDPNDFKDGTNQSGPYTHSYKDKDGNTIGQFILDITPPPSGSASPATSSPFSPSRPQRSLSPNAAAGHKKNRSQIPGAVFLGLL